MANIVDSKSIKAKTGSSYPAPFQEAVSGQKYYKLGDAVGLNQFGVNLVSQPPGCASSQRHWHSAEDEFVYILEGELILETDDGETRLTPGMVAGFPANEANGHRLINRSSQPAVYLEVGARDLSNDIVEYPDIDLRSIPDGDNGHRFVHKDGTPYDV